MSYTDGKLSRLRHTAAYFLEIAAVFQFTVKEVRVLHGLLWGVRPVPRPDAARLDAAVRHLRRQPVYVLFETDEVRAPSFGPFPRNTN